ncbi:hypothetical protein RD110_15890 [Rhodoferax koreense]|uniref:histidine kinase n=1 Tax=Rhodoferax koreensis TaxID=1842727 RepID=A0A1P8JXL4_9BURK|nr:sensor histidine kinase [Rhodoferax koreense]APW38500.1 hypothetical protein RD110_15890 [Rhodoferax koreense]
MPASNPSTIQTAAGSRPPFALASKPNRPPRSRWRREFEAMRGVRRRLVFMVLPWLVLLLILFPLAWHELDAALEGPLLRDRDDTVQDTSDIIVRTLGSLRRDVAFLSELTARQPLIDVSANSSIAQLFTSFAASAPQYDQVRWIDETGMERLRVNQRVGPPVVVSAAQLQNKGSRPYFHEALRLPAGSVYFSELDLNVENGVIERPLEPTLRVASPLVVNGQRRGIVVINYRANRLLERLAGLSRQQRIGVYLLNAQGYWIQGPNKADDWAGQLGRTDRALSHSQPALWQAVQQEDHGELRDAGGAWAFKRITPGQDLTLAGVRGQVADGALGLRLLVRIDPEAALQRTWRWKAVLATIFAVAVLITLRLGWQTGRNLAARKAHEEELQAANSALRQANEQLQTVQTELARADRLSSLGLMVAGVAHELNTPLGTATLALSTVQQRLDVLALLLKQGLRKSDLEDYVASSHAALDVVLTSLRRSAGIVQRFKQVAVDRTTMEQRRFDLAEIVLDADPRLRKWDHGNPVQLKLDLAPGLQMESYPGPLEQVIANLLDNALAHAFVNRPGGQITVRALADGPDHVCIWFSDDGIGVPESSLARIFDPFYTTSRHSGGTGLGLHIVYQLVHDVLGGSIEAANLAEGGMVFTLRLPRKAPLKKASSALSSGLLPLGEPPRRA